MNRAQRRAAAPYHRELAKLPWEPLVHKPLTDEQRARPGAWGNFQAAWLNNVVSVQAYLRATSWGEVIHLAVRRHDEKEIAGWDLLQRVKNELAGLYATALEVYPPDDQVKDEAPMRHLFVMPKGFVVPLTIVGPWR